MDTVRSWLDAKEVNRLAEGLLAPVSGEDGGKEGVNAQVNDQDVASSRWPEFSEDLAPKPSVKNALAAALKSAQGSGMLQNVSKPSPVGPDQSVATNVEKLEVQKPTSDVRELDLMLLLDLSERWSEQFELDALVLMAPDGEVLFDTLGNLKLTQMAQKLAKSATLKGNLFVRIGAGAHLQVMPVSQEESSKGSIKGQSAQRGADFMLGVVVAKALSADQVASLIAEVSTGLK